MELDTLTSLLPFLIPLVIAQLTLMVAALVHILKHPHYKIGNKALWISVVVLINLIGPILYFTLGRSEEEEEEEGGID